MKFMQSLCYLVLVSIVASACTKKKETPPKEIAKETADASNKNSERTLTLTEGFEGSLIVEFGKNALDKEAKASLLQSAAPKEFKSSDVIQEILSPAFKVEVGSKILSSKAAAYFKIKIPFSSKIARDLVNKDGLCILHKSKDNRFLLWHQADLLEINIQKPYAAFKTETFGIYQLAICGKEIPEGFTTTERSDSKNEEDPLTPILNAANKFSCTGSEENHLTSFSEIKECKNYLNSKRDCVCTQMRNLTLSQCATYLEKELKPIVCLSPEFTVNQSKISEWQEMCAAKTNALKSAFSEVCDL